MGRNKELFNLAFIFGIISYIFLIVGYLKGLNGLENPVQNTIEVVNSESSVNTNMSSTNINISSTPEKETIDIDNVNSLMNELSKTMYSHPDYNISNWKREGSSNNSEWYRLYFYKESITQPFSYYVETYTESYFMSELNVIERLLPTYIKRNSSDIKSSVSNNRISISTHFDSLNLKDGCVVDLSLNFGLWYDSDYYSLYFHLNHIY